MRELALHVLDIVQNSLAAGARNIAVEVDEQLDRDLLTITIIDDGKGMDAATVAKVLDPFTTSRQTRRVGLGLSLFAAAARRCDGNLTIQSEPGRGTRVTARFRYSHIDRAPLGDIPGTIASLISLNPDREFSYSHRRGDSTLSLSTVTMRGQLGEVPLSHPDVFVFIRQYLQDGLTSLGTAGS